MYVFWNIYHQFSQLLAKWDVNPLIVVIHFATLKPFTHWALMILTMPVSLMLCVGTVHFLTNTSKLQFTYHDVALFASVPKLFKATAYVVLHWNILITLHSAFLEWIKETIHCNIIKNYEILMRVISISTYEKHNFKLKKFMLQKYEPVKCYCWVTESLDAYELGA